MIQGKELLMEFADLINKSTRHCNKLVKTKDKTNKVGCGKCAFSRYYSLSNHGCFLIEMYEQGMIDLLESTMLYHDMDTSKISNLNIYQEE